MNLFDYIVLFAMAMAVISVILSLTVGFENGENEKGGGGGEEDEEGKDKYGASYVVDMSPYYWYNPYYWWWTRPRRVPVPVSGGLWYGGNYWNPFRRYRRSWVRRRRR